MPEQTPVAPTAWRPDPIRPPAPEDAAVLSEWCAVPAPPPAVPPEEVAVLAEWVAVPSPVPYTPPAARFEVDPALLNEWSAPPPRPSPPHAVAAERSAALAEAAATLAPPAGPAPPVAEPDPVLSEWTGWAGPPSGAGTVAPPPEDPAARFDPAAFDEWCALLTGPPPPGAVPADEPVPAPEAIVVPETVPATEAIAVPGTVPAPEEIAPEEPVPAEAPAGPVVVGAFEVAGLASGPGHLAFAGVSFVRRLPEVPPAGALRIEVTQSRNVAPAGVTPLADGGFAPDREGCTLAVAAASAGPFVAAGHVLLDMA
jgi:hypothetical protein